MRKLVLILLAVFLATPAFAMQYRVNVDVAFNDKADAMAFMNAVEKIKTKPAPPTTAISPTLHVVRSTVVHQCRHDELPPKQCDRYESIDFTKPEKIWE